MKQKQQEGVEMDEAERAASMEGEREWEREREIESERETERDRGMYETETAASSHGAAPASGNEAIRGMEAALFNAAREGNVEMIREKLTPGEVQRTPTEKTVLHIASEFDQYECVKDISQQDIGLLFLVDGNGDTALHVAARMSSFKTAKALIEAAKARNTDIESRNRTTAEELIRKTNSRGNTALHEAVDVRSPSTDIVKLLVAEVPKYRYPPNNRSETPLYVAAERGFPVLARAILPVSEPARRGPLGRTALHASVMSDLPELTEKLLKIPDLAKQSDDDCWTPLHWAACFDYFDTVRKLLEHDRTLAYIVDKDGLTSLHVAAMNNSVSSMKIITSKCPDCYDMVDNKGRNAFHYAVMHRRADSTKFLVEGSLFHSLLSKGDEEGNTAFHFCPPLYRRYLIRTWHLNKLDGGSLNNNNETADSRRFEALRMMNTCTRRKFLRGSFRRFRRHEISMEVEKEDQSNRKRGDTRSSYLGNQLVVAALIATVTFAAGFTLPGGYNDAGKAILSNKPMFKAFVIADALAFFFSMVVVFLQFYIPFKVPKNVPWNLDIAGLPFTPCAMLSMLIAFITGVSVALESSGLKIALQTISIGVSLMFFLHTLGIRNIIAMQSTLFEINKPV